MKKNDLKFYKTKVEFDQFNVFGLITTTNQLSQWNQVSRKALGQFNIDQITVYASIWVEFWKSNF